MTPKTDADRQAETTAKSNVFSNSGNGSGGGLSSLSTGATGATNNQPGQNQTFGAFSMFQPSKTPGTFLSRESTTPKGTPPKPKNEGRSRDRGTPY